jgi:hypothetical protein
LEIEVQLGSYSPWSYSGGRIYENYIKKFTAEKNRIIMYSNKEKEF